jgi:cell division protein FtsB
MCERYESMSSHVNELMNKDKEVQDQRLAEMQREVDDLKHQLVDKLAQQDMDTRDKFSAWSRDRDEWTNERARLLSGFSIERDRFENECKRLKASYDRDSAQAVARLEQEYAEAISELQSDRDRLAREVQRLTSETVPPVPVVFFPVRLVRDVPAGSEVRGRQPLAAGARHYEFGAE